MTAVRNQKTDDLTNHLCAAAEEYFGVVPDIEILHGACHLPQGCLIMQQLSCLACSIGCTTGDASL